MKPSRASTQVSSTLGSESRALARLAPAKPRPMMSTLDGIGDVAGDGGAGAAVRVRGMHGPLRSPVRARPCGAEREAPPNTKIPRRHCTKHIESCARSPRARAALRTCRTAPPASSPTRVPPGPTPFTRPPRGLAPTPPRECGPSPTFSSSWLPCSPPSLPRQGTKRLSSSKTAGASGRSVAFRPTRRARLTLPPKSRCTWPLRTPPRTAALTPPATAPRH
jgi:hypothetical protein